MEFQPSCRIPSWWRMGTNTVIHTVRMILHTVFRQQCLDDEGFHTVLCECEAILNDHPIARLSEDPNDLEP